MKFQVTFLNKEHGIKSNLLGNDIGLEPQFFALLFKVLSNVGIFVFFVMKIFMFLQYQEARVVFALVKEDLNQ